MSIENLFSQFFQDTFYIWNAHLDTRMVELIKTSCQAKAGEAVFHLNNKLNAPLNLKEIGTFFIRIFSRNTPVLALKISKRGVCVGGGGGEWACILGRLSWL